MSQFDDVDDSPGRQWLTSVAEHRIDVAWRTPPGGWCAAPAPPPVALLSGSFNPRHAGHVELRRAAETFLGVSAGYEMPLRNVDKPDLDVAAAMSRCRQFDDAPLAVTRSATFLEKSRLFPGAVFVVGIDTAIRIVDHRYYADSAGCTAALAEIHDRGCRFLVAPRLHQGQFLRLTDLTIPHSLRAEFQELPESLFRSDLSSTAIRRDHGRTR